MAARILLATTVAAGLLAGLAPAHACRLLECSPVPIRPCFLLATGERYCLPV